MRTKAELALILATLLWGLTFPFIRIVIQEISPLQLVFLRGAMASIVFAPFILCVKKDRKKLLPLFGVGAALGFLYYAGYLLQCLGLQTITSGRSAFITNLSIVFVPLLSPIFGRGLPSRQDCISCGIALLGMYFLTRSDTRDPIQVGDIWTIASAFCLSLQIHLIQWAMQHKPYPNVYTFWQFIFIAVFAFLTKPFLPAGPNVFPVTTFGIFSLLYLGAIAMVFAVWIQSQFQSQTTPERAAVIYILEPVFASMFGYFLLREGMSYENLLGCVLIVGSVVWIYGMRLFKKIYRSIFYVS